MPGIEEVLCALRKWIDETAWLRGLELLYMPQRYSASLQCVDVGSSLISGRLAEVDIAALNRSLGRAVRNEETDIRLKG